MCYVAEPSLGVLILSFVQSGSMLATKSNDSLMIHSFVLEILGKLFSLGFGSEDLRLRLQKSDSGKEHGQELERLKRWGSFLLAAVVGYLIHSF